MLTAFVSRIIQNEPFASDNLVCEFFESVKVIHPAHGSENQRASERNTDAAGSVQDELHQVHCKLQKQTLKMAELEKSAALLQQQNDALTHEANLVRRALDEERKKPRGRCARRQFCGQHFGAHSCVR